MSYSDLKSRILARSKWNGECLESTYKPKVSLGYPILKYKNKMITAHRASWISHFGEITKGLCVCHKCDNPICINPEHLFLGSNKDNSQDMINKKRHNYWGNQKFTQEIADKAIEMRKKGKTYKEISEELKVTITNVNHFFRRSCTKEEVKEFYGVQKYSEEIRKKAFELRDQGVLCKDIQKILGIPKRSLSRIFNNNK